MRIVALMPMLLLLSSALKLLMALHLLALLLTAHRQFSSARLQMLTIAAPCFLLLLYLHVIHIPGTILYGAHSGRQVMLPRITCIISPNQSHLPFAVMRRQFPVIPAYAYTVHRSQGSSLDLMGIYFNGEPFCHGLLFTALSRVRGDWSRISVFAESGSSHYLTNCVKHHVLQCLQ